MKLLWVGTGLVIFEPEVLTPGDCFLAHCALDETHCDVHCWKGE